MNRFRLTAVMTHPVQYLSPWFRYISTHCPEINLTVLYAVQPTPKQQGIGFGKDFIWDVPLTEGYQCRAVRPAREGYSVHSGDFWGLNVPEIKSAIYDTKPDVVLINGWHSVTQMRALWACCKNRIPVLYRGDTHLGNAPDGIRRLAWMAKTRFLLRLFDGYLSVGARAREYLRKFGAPKESIFNSPHCVDNDFFEAAAKPYQSASGKAAVRRSLGLDENDFVVLFIGKLEPKKRPLDLIHAAARLGEQVSLMIVGTGSEEKQCRNLSQKLGVNTVWAGFLNQSEIGRGYAAADCLALPSWGETWGLVVNEAIATGLPCVVSDRVGCAPDLIVKDETGEIFPMGDVDALTEALDSIKARTKTGHDWTRACKSKAKAYSFEKATSGLLTACNVIVKCSSPHLRIKEQRSNFMS